MLDISKRFIYLFHYQNKYLIEINIKSNCIFLGNESDFTENTISVSVFLNL